MIAKPAFTKSKTGLLICFLICFQLSNSIAQTSAWNSNSFKFSKDNTPLQDMAGATNVNFTGDPLFTSPSIPFGGFNFRYGLSAYANFYISPYGFIKLGNNIAFNDPSKDTAVIVPLYNSTFWNHVSYKLVGAAPNRKMVVEYIGIMQPSGEPTSFQIWLYERTGKIQFVYAQLRGYYGFASSQSYTVFCSNNILNNKTIAGLKINPGNTVPSIIYGATALSHDSIYANTRFTFEPDTLKPSPPTFLNFSNVHAACLSVNITENSNNESVIALERADSGINYKTEKLFYTSSPSGATNYSYSQSLLQPFWAYNYRGYVSNGFLNSDTLYNTVQTLMPEISGIKKIPGDYPTIDSLLQDAACKQIGPNLIIELQSNYSFASEPLPVNFRPSLQNRLIQSIVIRPAANATINCAANFAGALFYIDSVKHVFIDGRPGGAGTSQNLTIFQQNPNYTAIQYTNAADSGGINYCRVIKRTGGGASSAILVEPYNIAHNYPKKDINALSITNNYIAADSATIRDLIYIKPADTLKARDFIISGNQLSRFRRSAIYFENGGENLLISNNRFYQPVIMNAEAMVPVPYNYASCVSLINTGTVTVNNNFFGGGSATWGIGKFIMNANYTNFSCINYQNNSLYKKAFITNNRFGNIESQSIGFNGWVSKLIYALKGNVLIDNNRFGTSDSSNSITSDGYFWGVDLVYGNKTVSNNFFSGFQGSYLSNITSNDSYFTTFSFIDSCTFIHNDVGGSDDITANGSTGKVNGIELSGAEKYLTVKNNVFRGISSKNKGIIGINDSFGTLTGSEQLSLEIDSNSIHHLQSGSSTMGMALNANSKATNRISYNNIYALKTTGTTLDPNGYGYLGYSYGIVYTMYNYSTGPANYKGEVQIFGNKIHSFEAVRILPASKFSFYAITATSPITKIYNNEIRLGLDNKGQPIDSLTSLNGIGIIPADGQTFLSDKHFLEHNSIYFGGRGSVGAALSASYSYNYVSPNNSITITNNILNIDRAPLSGSNITADNFEDIASIKATSAKNLWYSSSITNTPALLQSYKQSCNCDSSSFVGNPVFINPTGDSSNYSLHLGPLSKADSSGTPSVLNIQVDLDNKDRNAYSPVDIGCYATSPCGSGTLPTITITSPTQDTVLLCSGSTVTLTSSISAGTFTTLQWQRNLIDSAGANATSLTVNTLGAYRLIGKTACGTVSSRTIYVVGVPLQPTVSIATPSTVICSGSTITFIATPGNIPAPISYQWQVNSVNAGINSNSFTTSVLANNDNVKVIATSPACGVSVTANSNIITVTFAPSPIANAGNNVAICTGSSTTLNGSGGNTYSWAPATGLSNAAIANPVASPTITTNYILTVTNSTNCIAKDTVVVTVNPIVASPTVSISTAALNICTGNTATFTATTTNAGTSPVYQWSINANNVSGNNNIFTSTTLNNNDQIKVVLTSNATCVTNNTATSNTIAMGVQQLATPVVTLTNKVFTVTNPDILAIYTWQILTNAAWVNVVPAASGITFTATTAGEYRVMAVKGVCTVYSQSQVSNLRATPVNNAYGINLYPNPSNQSITLDSIKLVQNWATLTILNAEGQIVLPSINIKNKNSVVLDVSGFRSGTYFVQLRRENGESTTISFIRI